MVSTVPEELTQAEVDVIAGRKSEIFSRIQKIPPSEIGMLIGQYVALGIVGEAAKGDKALMDRAKTEIVAVVGTVLDALLEKRPGGDELDGWKIIAGIMDAMIELYVTQLATVNDEDYAKIVSALDSHLDSMNRRTNKNERDLMYG